MVSVYSSKTLTRTFGTILNYYFSSLLSFLFVLLTFQFTEFHFQQSFKDMSFLPMLPKLFHPYLIYYSVELMNVKDYKLAWTSVGWFLELGFSPLLSLTTFIILIDSVCNYGSRFFMWLIEEDNNKLAIWKFQMRFKHTKHKSTIASGLNVKRELCE